MAKITYSYLITFLELLSVVDLEVADDGDDGSDEARRMAMSREARSEHRKEITEKATGIGNVIFEQDPNWTLYEPALINEYLDQWLTEEEAAMIDRLVGNFAASPTSQHVESFLSGLDLLALAWKQRFEEYEEWANQDPVIPEAGSKSSQDKENLIVPDLGNEPPHLQQLLGDLYTSPSFSGVPKDEVKELISRIINEG